MPAADPVGRHPCAMADMVFACSGLRLGIVIDSIFHIDTSDIFVPGSAGFRRQELPMSIGFPQFREVTMCRVLA
jgi:hypothetical protein